MQVQKLCTTQKENTETLALDYYWSTRSDVFSRAHGFKPSPTGEYRSLNQRSCHIQHQQHNSLTRRCHRCRCFSRKLGVHTRHAEQQRPHASTRKTNCFTQRCTFVKCTTQSYTHTHTVSQPSSLAAGQSAARLRGGSSLGEDMSSLDGSSAVPTRGRLPCSSTARTCRRATAPTTSCACCVDLQLRILLTHTVWHDTSQVPDGLRKSADDGACARCARAVSGIEQR